MLATSFCVTGLTRYSSAPPSSHAHTTSPWSKLLIITTGTDRSVSSDRMYCSNSIPFICGILTSVSTRWYVPGGADLSSSIASAPSSAVVTVYLNLLSSVDTNVLDIISSSTTSTWMSSGLIAAIEGIEAGIEEETGTTPVYTPPCPVGADAGPETPGSNPGSKPGSDPGTPGSSGPIKRAFSIRSCSSVLSIRSVRTTVGPSNFPGEAFGGDACHCDRTISAGDPGSRPAAESDSLVPLRAAWPSRAATTLPSPPPSPPSIAESDPTTRTDPDPAHASASLGTIPVLVFIFVSDILLFSRPFALVCVR